MTSLKKRRNREWLRKRSQQGMRGYPIGTIAFYGPTDKLATKLAVGVIPQADGEAEHLERWFSDGPDIREDVEVLDYAVAYLRKHEVRSVVLGERIMGCPHEEGIDYPAGEECPECPFWIGRDRFTGEFVQ